MTNGVFCDGHAESISTRCDGGDTTRIAAGTGFLSNDNSMYSTDR
jgi:prepilin-type processing-associated H-X9-DG protein